MRQFPERTGPRRPSCGGKHGGRFPEPSRSFGRIRVPVNHAPRARS
ncbi:hypothetical protein [Salidesulfovibrio onnuriiensis]|nr:hypothetical protein [Salidesulfovibrio onnuriiensis]